MTRDEATLSRQRIDEMLENVYPAFALLAAMQLGVFGALASGPMDAAQLAKRIDAHEDKLSLLLYTLAAIELVHVDNGLFQNSRIATAFLVPESPQFMGNFHELTAEVWSAVFQTAATVKAGIPAAPYDFTTMSEAKRDRFFRGLDTESRATAQDLSRRFSFADRTALVDLGGGSGGVSVGMLQRWPQLRATIMDLPNIVPITRKFVNASSVADRIEVVARDATTDHLEDRFIEAFDVAILRALIQVLGRNEAQKAIIQAGRMLKSGAKIYVVGRGVLDDSRTSPVQAAIYNLVFLNVYDQGQAYSESEYREWMEAAGFIEINRIIRPDGGSILTARKK